MTLDPEHHWWLVPATALATALIAFLLIPLASKAGLVDHPNQRKVHESVTPVTGGLAIFITLAVVFSWTLPGDRFIHALGAGSLLMTLTGMADDRLKLSTALRFLIQMGACLIMILYADVRLDDFGRLFYDEVLTLGWLAGPVTIFAAIGVINAFNMIDGMDGLAGSIFLVAAAGMAVFAARAGQGELQWTLLLSIGAVLGYLMLNARLPWNKKARVFLGDGGSLLLGFILAWCFIALGSDHKEAGVRAFMPITAVWLLAVPLLDTTTLMWSRWRSGRSAFSADQNHLHHAFLRAGFSVGETWVNITLLAIVLAAVGILFEISGAPGYVSFWTFMVVAFAYYAYIKKSWETQRFLTRNFIYNDFEL
jgi:UDP-GlcNAc:undecaprenyl-phosphate GlcNAc-1-phosphate transferase